MKVIWSEKFIDCYTMDPAAAPGRMEAIVEVIRDRVSFVPARPASEEEIAACHTKNQRVRVDVDPALRKDEAILTIEWSDGRRLAHHVEHARGYSPDNPATDADLEEKFVSLAEPVLGRERSRELARRTWALDSERSLKRWMELCRRL